MRGSRIVVSGLGTRLLEAGPPDATDAVVFVHGNPGSARDWVGLLSQAGELGRAVAFDMPGFGQGQKPRDFDYTVAGFAAFLERALAQLGVERAQLVLHDFGGPWGLRWAAAHPDAVASLVLIDTGVLIGYRWHYLARIWRTPILGELFQAISVRPAFRLVLRHGNPRGLPRAFVDEMHSNYDRATRRAVLRLYRATEPAALGELSAALKDRDIPTLVVWGRHDPYLPVEQAHRQLATFPGASVVVLDDSGHWPFIDDPDGVAAAVVPFLRERVVAAR